MSARAVIDSLQFVRGGTEMCGEVEVAGLVRLADSLHDRGGNLRYRLIGYLDGQQRPRLQLEVVGTISLRCQRCLGNLRYEIAVESSLLVLEEGRGGDAAEIEDLDAVAADPAMDVWSLVEDEVLLALPIAPRHAEGECEELAGADRKLTASPFAVLVRLKQ